ncbi:MAG: tRNA epoxyqueuosine(34) reductase QueG [Hyphomicrobiales bacterium]|nr:tRNA epoxyqueuosine(34) reductase QueG [Hyphomicrobiales bacterium]
MTRPRSGDPVRIRKGLDAKAAELGFAACRIVAPDGALPAGLRLESWLAAGHAGDMAWMAETRARRADPRVLWPQVRSIVMLTMAYGPEGDALATLRAPDCGNISVYARHRDYHEVIKGRLKQLGQWLLAQAGAGEIKVFVDTAPVMEKPLAAAAGLGWQGRHTNLVSRAGGSWLFLGAIFTNLPLAADAPEEDHCGSCRACLDICPTAAFPAPYQLDARRCISYLTIEHKGFIAAELRPLIGNRIYGCDDCLAVCPWNKFAARAQLMQLQARAEMVAPPLARLAAQDDAQFRAFFAGSPVKRIGHARFLRNVLIAIGNSADARLLDAALAHLHNEAALVRGMAVWACGRLASPAKCRELAAQHLPGEQDAGVRAEWQALGEEA